MSGKLLSFPSGAEIVGEIPDSSDKLERQSWELDRNQLNVLSEALEHVLMESLFDEGSAEEATCEHMLVEVNKILLSDKV